ncbi:hypothetical protein, partial [Acinetobacter baumannii]|uniref:hypothetical protein n=1 Tax=Acinetobacter baumannii TaxID=470 RepID=UPI0011126476
MMDVLDELQGKQQASALEESNAKITELLTFKPELEKLRETRRSTFDNKLIWNQEMKRLADQREQQFDIL